MTLSNTTDIITASQVRSELKSKLTNLFLYTFTEYINSCEYYEKYKDINDEELLDLIEEIFMSLFGWDTIIDRDCNGKVIIKDYSK